MSLNRNIPIKNIYYMLSYAFQSLQDQGYKRLETEEFNNMGELCAAIICMGTEKLIKRGVYKEYVPVEESMYAVKGRINVAETLKSGGYFRNRLVCEYDDFSVNSYLNRIIKTTAVFLIGSDISKVWKKQLRDLMNYFSEVELLDKNRINWKLNYNRNNATYQLLIAVCRMVIKGLLHTEQDGTTKLSDFLDEQHEHRLYEKFILEYYRKEHRDIKANPIRIEWALPEGQSKAHLPVMQTDITLQTKDESRTLVIDAKYYTHNMLTQFGSEKIVSGNLYQVFSYVKNLEAQNDGTKQIAGMLLYAKTLDQVQPDDEYFISGNKIVVRTLDLNQEFQGISRDLDEIYYSFINGQVFNYSCAPEVCTEIIHAEEQYDPSHDYTVEVEAGKEKLRALFEEV